MTQVIYRGKFACLYIKLMISAYRRYETNLLTVFVMFSSLLGIVVAAVDAMTFVPGSVGACLVRSDSGRWQGLHARLTVVTASGRRRRLRLHPPWCGVLLLHDLTNGVGNRSEPACQARLRRLVVGGSHRGG